MCTTINFNKFVKNIHPFQWGVQLSMTFFLWHFWKLWITRYGFNSFKIICRPYVHDFFPQDFFSARNCDFFQILFLIDIIGWYLKILKEVNGWLDPQIYKNFLTWISFLFTKCKLKKYYKKYTDISEEM